MSTRKIYTNPLSVVEEFFFCGVPFKMDSYSGCIFFCLYCFARARDYGIGAKKYYRGEKVIPADPLIVRDLLVKAIGWPTKSEDIVVEWLRHRIPIHWGGSSDPFQPLERRLHVTRYIMDYLNNYQYPTVISTKSTMLTEPDYLARLKSGKYAVQISLINDDDALIKRLEPNAPSATERLKALEVLAKNGLWTACRIQPVIPASPIETGLPKFIAKLASVGVKHVVVEGYKIPIWNIENRRAVDEACGGKVELEYRLVGARQKGMEILLPSWRKWQYIQPAIQAAHEYGLTYGAADNDFRDMGDVKCCCGIDNLPGFENYWQYQTARAAEIAKQNGCVTLADMQSEWHGTKPFAFNKQGLTFENGVRLRAPVKYYIDKVWNLADERSPACMVNMVQVIRDGKVAYEYHNRISGLDRSSGKQMELM